MADLQVVHDMILTAVLLKDTKNPVFSEEDELVELLISLQKDAIILVFISPTQR